MRRRRAIFLLPFLLLYFFFFFAHDGTIPREVIADSKVKRVPR